MTTTVIPPIAVPGARPAAKGRAGAGRPRRPGRPGTTIGERNRLVLAYQPLLRAVARRYRGLGMELDDLVSEGQFGLLRAAELFDPSYQGRFGRYATHWIRQAILAALLARGPMVRVPRGARELARRYRRAARPPEARRAEPEPEPGPSLEGGAGGHRPSTLRAALAADRLRRAGWSEVEAPRRARGSRGADGHPFARVDDRDWVAWALARLPEREAAAVRARFGLDGDEPELRHAGRRLGIGPERVRQLTERALGRIRGWSPASGAGPWPARARLATP